MTTEPPAAALARALIDAEFHDTPIGRCVVLPPWNRYRSDYRGWGEVLSAGDVLAVVDSSSISDAVPKWLRRGFVRVVEVLPVVLGSDDEQEIAPCLIWWNDEGWMTYWDAEDARDGIFLPVSPGDVVLVVEPWCETCEGSRGWVMPSPSDPWRDCPACAPSPARVIRRDGVLGEVEA